MSLRLWRKHNKFAYPGTKFASRKKASLWHTISLNPKYKAYYTRKNKVYSSELRTSLYPTKNPVQQWRYAYKEYKTLHWRTLYASSFWVFKNPMAVPGAVQMRRSKSVYSAQQQAIRNLHTWLHRIIYPKLFHHSHCSSHFLVPEGNKHHLVFLLEAFWPSMLTKIGFLDTIGDTKMVFKHKGLLVNGKIQKKHFSIPGDVFFINPSFWLRPPYYKQFHAHMFK